MTRIVVGMALVLVLGVVTQGLCQEPLTAFTPKQLRALLEKQGVKIEDEGGDAQQSVFAFRVATRPVLLFNFADDKVLMLRYSKKAQMSLEVVNSWNTLSSRSRAWVDTKKGIATVEADLDFAGGVTPKNLENFLKQFGTTTERFDAVIKELKEKK